MADDVSKRLDEHAGDIRRLHTRVNAVEQTQASLAATEVIIARTQEKHADYLLDPKEGLAVRQALVEQVVKANLDRKRDLFTNGGLIAAAAIGSLLTWWLTLKP